jgi:2-(3-amino-3-carboxypropyl)histidine synthase
MIKEQMNDHVNDIILPQTKPLSPGEILGCTSPILPQSYDIVYIGDGRFHIESIMIHNPDALAYKFVRCCTIIVDSLRNPSNRYDPYSKEFTREYYDTTSMHTIRQKEIEKASHGQVWGIVLGSLGRQGSTKVLQVRTFNGKTRLYVMCLFVCF